MVDYIGCHSELEIDEDLDILETTVLGTVSDFGSEIVQFRNICLASEICVIGIQISDSDQIFF